MLQINKYEQGTYKTDPLGIATSTTSPYTPLINYQRKEIVYVQNIEQFDLYYKLKPYSTSISSFRINSFFDSLNCNIRLDYMWLDVTRTTKILVGKGCIYDNNDKLLLMLSVKAGKDVNFHDDYSDASKENAANMNLFVSTELLMNPIYTIFYKKLYKGYIEQAMKIDLPVIFTTSDEIERLHYSNNFKVEFNSIDNFQHHLRKNVGNIMFLNNDQFKEFNPGIGKYEKVIQNIHPEEMTQDEISEIEQFLNQNVVAPIQMGNGSVFDHDALQERINELTNIPLMDRSVIPNTHGLGYQSLNNITTASYNVAIGTINNHIEEGIEVSPSGITLIDDTDQLSF